MHIDVLCCIYTIQFLHSLTAVYDERYSSLCFTVKEKSSHAEDSSMNTSTGSTPTRACYIKNASARTEEDTLCQKCSGYLRKLLKIISLYAFVSCQWRRGRSRPHPGEGAETDKYKQLQSRPNNMAARTVCLASYRNFHKRCS